MPTILQNAAVQLEFYCSLNVVALYTTSISLLCFCFCLLPQLLGLVLSRASFRELCSEGILMDSWTFCFFRSFSNEGL